MKNQPTNLINVLFIDPYKKEIRKVELGKDLSTWYQALRCDCVDCQRITSENGVNLDIWFDDEFLLKEPIGPGFKLGDGREYRGYAFLAGSDEEGETVSLSPIAFELPEEVLGVMLGIRWERYEKRLGTDACLEERMRTPEIEMQGRFKFLDICPKCGSFHS